MNLILILTQTHRKYNEKKLLNAAFFGKDYIELPGL